MEVNSSPGLEGMEKSTGIDIAEKIMEYIEKNVTPTDPNNPTKRKIKKDNYRCMMNHDDLIIGGFSIPKGKETSINLELPKLYSTPTELPLKVLRGNTGKKVVFISAAIHGDELNGVEIIRRLRKLSLLKKLKGTLILAPIVNPYGVMNLSRYLPDRRDLNRSFPGNTKGSLASRIAKIFFDEIVLKSDFGIDLHTGAVHKSNLPQIRTNIFNEETFKLAKAFEAPLILHSELRDGSLRSEAAENGTPILLYEAGEALRFDENAIRIDVRGIVNVLRENGMLPRKKPTKKTVHSNRYKKQSMDPLFSKRTYTNDQSIR